jgi:hypothetical protein
MSFDCLLLILHESGGKRAETYGIQAFTLAT